MTDLEIDWILKSSDLYSILGVGQDASAEQLKKAFKQKALKFHPDKNKHPKSQEVFKKISAAY